MLLFMNKGVRVSLDRTNQNQLSGRCQIINKKSKMEVGGDEWLGQRQGEKKLAILGGFRDKGALFAFRAFCVGGLEGF